MTHLTPARPFHICLLSSMHTATDKRVVDKVATALIASGYKVTHVCPQDEAMPVHAGLTTFTYPRPRGIRGRVGQFSRLYRQARAIDADAYHCNEVDSWLVGLALKWRLGRLCIFDVHEHYPSTFAESRFAPVLRPIVERALRAALGALSRYTDRIVLAKRSVRDDYKVPDSKIVLVQNFVPKAALSKADESVGGNSIRSDGPFRIIHTGLISRVRGWPQMLEALSLTNDPTIQLRIIGQFNDNSKTDFDSKAIELGVQDRISYAPWMPFKDLMAELRMCDAGLVLFQPGIQNHVFALPHKMFDYMLAGIPTIAPAFAREVADIVRQTDCGQLVDPTDPMAIAVVLDRLAGDRSFARQLGAKGRAAVLADYNWENEAERLVAMYRDLANTPARAAVPTV